MLISKKEICNYKGKIIYENYIQKKFTINNEKNESIRLFINNLIQKRNEKIFSELKFSNVNYKVNVNNNGDLIISKVDVTSLYTNTKYELSDSSTLQIFYNFSESEIRSLSSIELQNAINNMYRSYRKNYTLFGDVTVKIITTVNQPVLKQLKIAQNKNIDNDLFTFQKSTNYDKDDEIVDIILSKIKLRSLTIPPDTHYKFFKYNLIKKFYPFVILSDNTIFDLKVNFNNINFINLLNKDSSNTDNFIIKSYSLNTSELVININQHDSYIIAKKAGDVIKQKIGEDENVKNILTLGNEFVLKTIDETVGSGLENYNLENIIESNIDTTEIENIFKNILYYNEDIHNISSNNFTIVSKYMTDYGSFIPIYKQYEESKKVIRFQDGVDFGILIKFDYMTNAGDNIYEYLKNGNFRGISTTPLFKEYTDFTNIKQQPIMNREEFGNNILDINFSRYNVVKYNYSTYKNQFTGDFLYLNDYERHNSSAFMEYTGVFNLNLPKKYVVDEGRTITEPIDLTVRAVFSVGDIHDQFQIKDSYNKIRYDVIRWVQNYINAYLQSGVGLDTSFAKDIRLNTSIINTLLARAIVDTLAPASKVEIENYYKSKIFSIIENSIIKTFIKVLKPTREEIRPLNDIKNVSKYIHAYKCIWKESSEKELSFETKPYTVNLNLVLSPVNIPISPGFLKQKGGSFYYNILTQNVTANVSMGGGLIKKKRQVTRQYKRLFHELLYKENMNKMNYKEISINMNTFLTGNFIIFLKKILPSKEIKVTLSFMKKNIDDVSYDFSVISPYIASKTKECYYLEGRTEYTYNFQFFI